MDDAACALCSTAELARTLFKFGVVGCRSNYVKTSLDDAKLDGVWYEHAYIDFAQVPVSDTANPPPLSVVGDMGSQKSGPLRQPFFSVQIGSSCQLLNSSHDGNGTVSHRHDPRAEDPSCSHHLSPVRHAPLIKKCGLQVTMDFEVTYLGKGNVPFTIVEVYTPDPSLGDGKGVYKKRAQEPGGQFIQIPTVVVDVQVSPDGKYETMTLYSCAVFGTVHELVFATRNRTVTDTVLGGMESTAKSLGVTWNAADLKKVDHSKCPDARSR